MEPIDLEAVLMASRPALLRFLRARGAGDDAEDLLQTLWMKASARSAADIAEPLSYLYRMADNLMLDRRRGAQRQGRRESEWSGAAIGFGHDVSDAPSVERQLIGRERLRKVDLALDALGDRTAAIFRRFRIDGIGQRDIAEEQGISLSAVEKHLQKAYRAIVDIQRALDAEPHPPRRPDTERANDAAR